MARIAAPTQRTVALRPRAELFAALANPRLTPKDFADSVLLALRLSKHATTLDLTGAHRVTSRNLAALFAQLPNLKRLCCRDLQLTQIPAAILELGQLQELDLSLNPLQELPASLRQLRQLRYLDVAQTELQALPAALTSLHELRYFNASQARLQHITADLSGLGELRTLRLSAAVDVADVSTPRVRRHTEPSKNWS